MNDSRKYSVNDEFAIDPAIAARVSELRMLLSKFGFYEGRFISRFPAGWIKAALERVSDQNLRQKVHILLERNKETAFVRSNRPYDSLHSWIENAIEQHARAPFGQVISAESAPGFVHLDDVDPTTFPGSRDSRVTGSLENIVNVIRPLIRVSGSLYLIDPYFHPWSAKARELTIAVLAEMKIGAEFKAFVSAKNWPDFEFADKHIRKILQNESPLKGRLKIQVCDDESSSSGMHARYLFSEKGGVRLDKGLQTDEAEIDLSFIDKRVHDDLVLRFVERPIPYRVVREYCY